jgi:DNA repair photolyase
MAKYKAQPETLFPMLESRPTGIARLAAEGAHTDDGHLIEFRELAVRSILNKSVSRRRGWMAYSINPYRGCEFGCRYCFARYTHEFLQPQSIDPKLHKLPAAKTAPREPQDWATAFEHEIYMKKNAAWLLQQELRKFDPANEIAIGTATDPYQPIERRMEITRSILEVFERRAGYTIGIITKSLLVARDAELLAKISERNRVVVHVSITTTDAALARKLEPRAPRPDLRFEAVRRLRQAGVTAGILCAPVLPGITDNAEAFDRMAARAAEAKTSFLGANPLFLKACSRPTYLKFVRENFPELEAEYLRRFARSDFADEAYAGEVAGLVEAARRKYGIGSRTKGELFLDEEEEARKRVESVVMPQQEWLFG